MAEVTSKISRSDLKKLMRVALRHNITIAQAAARMIAEGLNASRRKHVNKFRRK